jgi:NitT/TauT family transport system substrate-binding protein
MLSAQAMTKIRIGSTQGTSISGSLYAQESGLFQRNGIDASIVTMGNGAATIAAILSGSLEFGNISMLNLVEAHSRGLPMLAEYAAVIYSADVHDAIALVVAKDSPIRSGRDMGGKTLSVPALGDTFTIAGSTWIDKTGGDSRTVKFLELTNTAAAEAIAAGRIDAAILTQPTLKHALADGRCRIIGDPFAAIAPSFVSTVYACSTDFASKNAAAMARFRQTLGEASAYVNQHTADMLPILAKFTGIDVAVLANLPFSRMGSSGTLKNAYATIQPLIDGAVKYKLLAHSFDAKDLVDPAVLS